MMLIVSLHDVHPGSLVAVERQRSELRELGVRKFSLLVVPNWHGKEPVEYDQKFVETVSRWRDEGDEIVLHGWTHSCLGLEEKARDLFWTRLYTSREAEFLLANAEETRVRLVTGRALFEQLGWPVVGFIAPAWLMAPHCVPTLRELGFAYTNTRTEFQPLANNAATVLSPSLCYSTRSTWRRLASLAWNRSLARSRRHSSLLRISLHPGDIAYTTVWRQIKGLCREATLSGRRSTTYRDFVTTSSGALPGPSPSRAPFQRSAGTL